MSAIPRSKRRIFFYICILFIFLALPAGKGIASQLVFAVGDGSNIGPYDEQVANLIVDHDPDAFLYLGDVYTNGGPIAFQNYDESYGQLFNITYPTAGNHEWPTRRLGYWQYWLPRFNEPDYFDFNIGSWRIFNINSESDHEEGSDQLKWLKDQLDASSDNCNIAFFHRPRYSAGSHGDQADMEPVFRLLKNRVALTLSGHDHNYQRFEMPGAPRQLVVGTGGRGFYEVDPSHPYLASSKSDEYGALKLELSPGRIKHEFITVDGATFDPGEVTCRMSSNEVPTPSKPSKTGSSVDQRGPITQVDNSPVKATTGDSVFRLSVKVKKRQNLRYALRRGIAVRIRCRKRCSVDIRVKTKNRLKRIGRKTIARRKVTLRGVKSRLVRVKPSRRVRKILRRRKRIRLIITTKANDQENNSKKRSRRVTLRK